MLNLKGLLFRSTRGVGGKKSRDLISEDHFSVLKLKLKFCPAHVSISAR